MVHSSLSSGYLLCWKSPSACTFNYFSFQNEMDHLSVELVLRYTYGTIRDLKNQPFFSLRKRTADAFRAAEQTLCSPPPWKENKADSCAFKTDFFQGVYQHLCSCCQILSATRRRTCKGLEKMQVNLVCPLLQHARKRFQMTREMTTRPSENRLEMAAGISNGIGII